MFRDRPGGKVGCATDGAHAHMVHTRPWFTRLTAARRPSLIFGGGLSRRAANSPCAGPERRLVHNAPYGARAPSALGGAAEAAIDLPHGPGLALRGERRTHVLVAEHVA